jgi:hypothetical protein
MKKFAMGVAAAGLGLLGAVLYVSAADEPPYEVLETFGDVELRRYGASIHAAVPMSGTDDSFRRLAGFIFGGNDAEESISMTAPVQMDIGSPNPEMAFIMPGGYDMATLPRPNDDSVLLREVPARTVAVLRFSGRASLSSLESKRRALEETLRGAGVTTTGKWSLNQYDPPWIPGPVRRNEIWVDVQTEAAGG